MVNEVSMNPNEQRQTFDALIQQHLPLRPAKLRMLMELRESIAEAREKGASYEVICGYRAVGCGKFEDIALAASVPYQKLSIRNVMQRWKLCAVLHWIEQKE